MKTEGLVVCCLLLVAGCATQPYDPFADPANWAQPTARPALSIEDAYQKLKQLTVVDGDAVYYGAVEGEFYKLSLAFIEVETQDGFLKMLDDPNPVVRVMGMWCLNKSDRKQHLARIKSMYSDTAEVDFVPAGCVVNAVSVGEIAKQVVKNPHLLEWRHHAEQQERDSQQPAEELQNDPRAVRFEP